MITDQPIDPLTTHYLWSTNSSSSFNGVKRVWMTDADKSDAACRRIVYYKTNAKGKISTILVPSIPEDDPACKVKMVTNFNFNTNDYWHNPVYHNVGGRILAYNRGIDGEGYTFPVSNNAIVYEAFSMDYDEDDYKLVPGGISGLGTPNEYQGMSWINAQLYRKPKSDTVDFMIINPRFPSHGSSDFKAVVVESIGESEDGFILEGYAKGEPYSATIKPGTRVMESVPYRMTEKTDESGNIIYDVSGSPSMVPGDKVTKDMLPELKAKGEKLYLLSSEDEHLGATPSPEAGPDSLESGDILRVLDRDGEIVYVEMVRPIDTGVVNCYMSTYTNINYAGLLNWNACIKGKVVDADYKLHRVSVYDYYWGSWNNVHGLSARTMSQTVDDTTLFLHTDGIPVSIYDTETGECYPGDELDIQVGDEIFSWKYAHSPAEIIIIR